MNTKLTSSIITLVLAAGLFAPAFAADAINDKKAAHEDNEMTAAIERLENQFATIESQIAYTAPSAETYDPQNPGYAEAVDRLEKFNAVVEQSLVYQAPYAGLYFENADIAEVRTRLDETFNVIESHLVYAAPADEPLAFK